MSKFNFRQIGGSRVYKAWKEWKEGDFVVGKFTSQYTDNYGNPGYELEVIDSSFDIQEGKIMGINSCGSLNYKMSDVSIGDTIKIQFEGEDVIEKGKYKGKTFNNVSVFLAGEETDETSDNLEGDIL